MRVPYGRLMTPINPDLIQQLDPTGRDILSLLASGLSNREIADRVYLSYQTVRNRVSLLLELTGAANRTQLALMMCSRCPNCPDAACPANPAAPLSPAGRVAGGDPHP